MKYLALALIALGLLSAPAEARHRYHVKTYAAHPDCNRLWPCEGVAPSPRGLRIVKSMGGFGSAQQRYTPAREHHVRSEYRHNASSIAVASAVVAHPSGCPVRAFCGCGASVRVFGHSVRELWLASNWYQFSRTSPAPGMVAVHRHHVFVLEADLGDGRWKAYDANSGGHLTRVHARSLNGYTIVDPHSHRYASR